MVIPIRDENPTRRRPVVTVALIAANLVVYFGIQFPMDEQRSTELLFEHATVPCEVTSGDPVVAVPVGMLDAVDDVPECAVAATGLEAPTTVFPDKNIWFSIVASMFLHGSVLHVLGNMLFLWIFGNNVEDRLGPVLFVVFYLLTGAVAAATHIALHADSTVPVVGASGAIAGVMGAYIVWFPRARVLSLVPIIFFFTFVELPALAVLGLWFVLQFLTSDASGVAWTAHVGGFVAGALVALAWRERLRPLGTWPDRDDRDGWDGGFRGGYPGRQ